MIVSNGLKNLDFRNTERVTPSLGLENGYFSKDFSKECHCFERTEKSRKDPPSLGLGNCHFSKYCSEECDSCERVTNCGFRTSRKGTLPWASKTAALVKSLIKNVTPENGLTNSGFRTSRKGPPSRGFENCNFSKEFNKECDSCERTDKFWISDEQKGAPFPGARKLPL